MADPIDDAYRRLQQTIDNLAAALNSDTARDDRDHWSAHMARVEAMLNEYNQQLRALRMDVAELNKRLGGAR